MDNKNERSEVYQNFHLFCLQMNLRVRNSAPAAQRNYCDRGTQPCKFKSKKE